ncbi:uridine diphosphate glucose pyrophosphatase NUDT14-like [Arctopsyche grandis]|uniref:uridine diphosphate glucose pyrophosphatase NUDT14-like n=1 Tax=Arctopsyche grandis TaxID=121162 RepID=UPI00406D68BC
MQDLQNVYVSPLPDSPYVKPFRLNYQQNGMVKNWDLLEVHDSVAIIIYNLTRNKLVMVKQFRPAVYYSSVPRVDKQDGTIDTEKYPASLGITLELCAGIIDKDKSWDEIAQEEVLEECGYNVPADSLEFVMKYRSGVGTSGSLQALYYCEVNDGQKVNQGGGVDDEVIDVIEMSIEEAEGILSSNGPHSCPPSFLFGLTWFMMNKAPKLRSAKC